MQIIKHFTLCALLIIFPSSIMGMLIKRPGKDYKKMHLQHIIQNENNQCDEVRHINFDCPLINPSREILEEHIRLINNTLLPNKMRADINYEQNKITLIIHQIHTGSNNRPEPKQIPIAYIHMPTESRSDANGPFVRTQHRERISEIRRRLGIKEQVYLSFRQKLFHEVYHDLIPSYKSIGDSVGFFIFYQLGLFQTFARFNQSAASKELESLDAEMSTDFIKIQQFHNLHAAGTLLNRIQKVIEQNRAEQKPLTPLDDLHHLEEAENKYLEQIEELISSLAGNPS